MSKKWTPVAFVLGAALALGVQATAQMQRLGSGTLSNPALETLDMNGNDIDDLGNVTFQTGATGGTLRTGTSNADKFVLQGYDVDNATYRTVLQINAGNTVTTTASLGWTFSGDVTLDSSAIIDGDGTEVFLVRADGDTGDLLVVDQTGDNVEVGAATLILPSAGTLQWSTDAKLHRDAANTLALRNSTSAQTSRIYGTFTDASNYERLSLSHDGAGTATIAAETAGTGANDQDIVLTPAGAGSINPGTDNTYDLGTTALRYRRGFFSSRIEIGNNPSTAGELNFGNDSSIEFRNAADTADLTVVLVDSSNNTFLGVDTNLVLGPSGSNSIRLRGSSLGFFNVAPASQTAAYTQTGSTTRTLDCSAMSDADAIATCQALQQVIDDLQAYGLFQ